MISTKINPQHKLEKAPIKKDDFSLRLQSNYLPSGDQPEAIRELTAGLNDGIAYQTLLGVTGSGKTFTIANVIEQVQRLSLIHISEPTRPY